MRLADQIGAEALLRLDEPSFMFDGPAKHQFAPIAEKTVAVLNQGATFSDLGLSVAQVENDIAVSATIGGFLSRLGKQIGDQESHVRQLLRREQCRLWVIVLAGNEPDAFVSALTRGRYAAIDTERLMASTEANIVTELKAFPEKIGILGTVLDARILYLPVLSILDIVRAFSDESLRIRMRAAGLSLKPDSKVAALTRLNATELAQIFAAGAQGTLASGPKVGSSSTEAFAKLAKIASVNDASLNRTIGRALQAAELIQSFEVEKDFGKGLKRTTDILAQTSTGPTRIEVMWRERTSRAAIANYVLTKLSNYGRAMGYLS